MYKGNLLMLFISMLVVILLLGVSINLFITGKDIFLYVILLLIIYLVYVAYMMLKEFKVYRLDKQNGIEEAILKFDNFKVHFESLRDNMPPVPVAVFKFRNSNKTIALMGDYRKIRLVVGRSYNVRFCRYSGIMVEIKER